MSTPTSGTRDPDLLQVGKALQRAALRAQELARQTGTPCYIWRDGRVVNIGAPVDATPVYTTEQTTKQTASPHGESP